jgi:HPr kinase/phosphorylase
MPRPTIHASAVLIGARAVLIQGPSGSGKSQLALALLEAAQTGTLSFAQLVADDRAEVEAMHGRLLVGLIVDLAAPDATRMPEPAVQSRKIEGIILPRLAVAAGQAPLRLVLSYLRTCEDAL